MREIRKTKIVCTLGPSTDKGDVLRQLMQEVYESRIRQKQYEMTALRAQINPHFLYNSLSLINWKALEIGSDDISKATLALSRYYRTSLNKGKNTMSIREEIDNVRSYLQIQEMFHDYSLRSKWMWRRIFWITVP